MSQNIKILNSTKDRDFKKANSEILHLKTIALVEGKILTVPALKISKFFFWRHFENF